MNRLLTNLLLLAITLLLAANLVRTTQVHAASSRVNIERLMNPGTYQVSGDVVGFSCVADEKGYAQCYLASR